MYSRLDLKQGNDQTDVLAWEILYDDYLGRFGLNKDYLDYLKLEKKLAIAKLKYVETRNRYFFNEIETLELKIEQMEGDFKKGQPIEEVLDVLAQWMGFEQDTRKITTLQYFTRLKRYREENKAKSQTK